MEIKELEKEIEKKLKYSIEDKNIISNIQGLITELTHLKAMRMVEESKDKTQPKKEREE